MSITTARPRRPTALLAAALMLGALAMPASAQEKSAAATGQKRHYAMSLVGAPAMPPDFKAFPWVNPDAPKSGTLREAAIGSFDSLNPFSIKGEPADGLGLISDPLFQASPDEPSTEYGLVAEWATYPDDFSSVTFGIRKEARFHDGRPMTPEDVIFSLDALKKANPQQALYYKNVVKAEKVGDHEVRFVFDAPGNRELPLIVSQLQVLPKHYWEGKGANGQPRDVTNTTLEVPVGSGPYKVKSFEAGRNIVYERNKEYWAKDLPVTRGQWNFDEIRYEFYRDRVAAFEAFKAGQLDFWQETSARAWAAQYNFDAVTKGQVRKEELANKRVAGMQSFEFNTRRKQFQDVRVRRAIGFAFDFESANKTLFNGAYVRTSSYFDNSELKATGLPQGRELEILSEVKAEIPPEVFTTEWKNPVNTTPDDLRNHMREAVALLNAAGWTQKGGQLVNAAGEALTVEILLVQPDFERIALPFIENLKKLGVKASVRTVDSSQYQRRLQSFDFDMIVHSIGQSHSPGNEQRFFFGSAAAKQEGSRNYIGVASPAIDKIIDKIVYARDRADLLAATHALDRVLLWSFYVVPQWHYPFDRIAVWDVFGHPAKPPSQSPAIQQTWWFDAAKQKAMAAARGGR